MAYHRSMATISNAPVKQAPGVLSRLGMSARRWASSFIAPSRQIKESDTFLYGAGSTTVRPTGNRQAVGQVSTDHLRQVVDNGVRPDCFNGLAAVGNFGPGRPQGQDGDLVFVEKTPDAKKNKQLSTIAEEVAADLTPLFNRVAFQIAYLGAVFIDAYAQNLCRLARRDRPLRR